MPVPDNRRARRRAAGDNKPGAHDATDRQRREYRRQSLARSKADHARLGLIRSRATPSATLIGSRQTGELPRRVFAQIRPSAGTTAPGALPAFAYNPPQVCRGPEGETQTQTSNGARGPFARRFPHRTVQRIGRNSRARPPPRDLDRHRVARAERPRRRQPPDAPARARRRGQARLFAQPVRPQSQARADRPRRRDFPERRRRDADQHGVPVRPRGAQAAALGARPRSRDLSRGRRRRSSRALAPRDRARLRRRAYHRRHHEARPARRLSHETR